MNLKNENYAKHLRDLRIFTDKTNFFRQGKIGNWISHLTQEQSKQIDDAISKKLKAKIVFNYGDKINSFESN